MEVKQGPRRVRAGIVAESSTDVAIYQKICKKIGLGLAANVIFPAGCSFNTDKDGESGKGGIKIKHLAELKKFYDNAPCKKLDLVIIFTDHDGGKGENINDLQFGAEKLAFGQKLLFVEPVENIEGWLLQDQVSANSIFGKQNKIFSTADSVRAKEIFNDLSGKAGIGKVDARLKFAGLFDVNRVKAKDFLDFKNDFSRIVRELINPKPSVKKNPTKKQNKPKVGGSITKKQAQRIIYLLEQIKQKMDILLKRGGEN